MFYVIEFENSVVVSSIFGTLAELKTELENYISAHSENIKSISILDIESY